MTRPDPSRPRLTGGHARGRPLAARVPEEVRPTSSRVREALFSLVGQDLTGVRVLDAFGGSGLLGFEAWSRGATVCVVEREPRVVKAIRENAAALGAEVEIRGGDVLALAADLGTWDLVLADPPYRLDAAAILAGLAPVVGGTLVLETDERVAAPAAAGLRLDRRRVYGGTALCVYEREGA